MRRVKDADWKRILRVIDEAYADYVKGMAALRQQVVGDVKRKLSRDDSPEGSTPRSAPARKRR